ncbi:MAG: hypothetical protein R2827_05255 [Bdellovibrionales bacterium]
MPEVVTAVPIVVDSKLKYLWLCVGTAEENQAVKSLSDMETIAMQLIDTLQNETETAAAA